MAKVSQTTLGQTTYGLTAGDDEAVFTVNTGDLVFDGGSRTFTLNASEPGKNSRIVNVKLNITPNHTGAAVFKLLEKTDGVEYLERLGGNEANFDGLVSAFKWVEQNAEADTEYTIRIEKNETDLPHMVVSLNKAEGASLRLRGTKDGPKILEPKDINLNGETLPSAVNEHSLTYGDGFIQVGNSLTSTSMPLITFILGNNITIKSGNAGYTGSYSNVFYAGAGGTLVLEPGSTIQDHYVTSASGVIRVTTKNNNNKDSHFHGRVRILGGAITNCTTTANKGLINFSRALSNYADDSFYLAPNSGFTITNTYAGSAVANTVYFNTDSYSLTEYLQNGVSIPPAP
jgi:hypothetical protein